MNYSHQLQMADQARKTNQQVMTLLRKATNPDKFDLNFEKRRGDLGTVVRLVWPIIKDDPRVRNYAQQPGHLTRYYPAARAARHAIADAARQLI